MISSSIANVVSEVCTLDCISNFSDHRPILARCDLHLGGLATTTEMPSKCGSLIVWDNASNEYLQRYSRLVCQRLDDLTLADSIVYRVDPSCQKHQDAYCNAICECLCQGLYSCSINVSVAGWNDSASFLKQQASLWHQIWTECRSPSVGVVAQIKKKEKLRLKQGGKEAAELYPPPEDG